MMLNGKFWREASTDIQDGNPVISLRGGYDGESKSEYYLDELTVEEIERRADAISLKLRQVKGEDDGRPDRNDQQVIGAELFSRNPIARALTKTLNKLRTPG